MAGRILNKRDKIITDTAMLPRIYDKAHFGDDVVEYYLDRVELSADTSTTVTIPVVNQSSGCKAFMFIAPGGYLKEQPDGVVFNTDDVQDSIAYGFTTTGHINYSGTTISIVDGEVTQGLDLINDVTTTTNGVNIIPSKINRNALEIILYSDSEHVLTDLHFIAF